MRTRAVALGMVTCLVANVAAAQDRPLSWTLQPLLEVGGTSDSTVILSTVHWLDVSAATGNGVAILDHLENQILLLRPDGTVERRLGRRGPGPGELTSPSGVVSAPDGSIWTWDRSRQKLIGFTTKGSVLPERSAMPGAGLLQTFAITSAQGIAVMRTHRDSINLWFADSGGAKLLARTVQPPARSIRPGNCSITDYLAQPVFTPSLIWAARGMTIASNDDASFNILLHGGRFNGKVLGRTIPQRTATSDLAKKALGDGWRISTPGTREPCLIPASEILRTVGFAARVPAYNRLLFTSPDVLWAVRYTLPGEPHVADVYNLERGYVGTIRLGAANPIAARTDGGIISLEADANDAPLIVVYRVNQGKTR